VGCNVNVYGDVPPDGAELIDPLQRPQVGETLLVFDVMTSG